MLLGQPILTSESNRSSSLLFTDIKDRIAVGSPYLIYEPSTNKNDLVLKENQLEITSSYPLLPLNHNIYECMVDIKPKEGSMGEQTFFLMKNQKIKLIRSESYDVKPYQSFHHENLITNRQTSRVLPRLPSIDYEMGIHSVRAK